MNIKLSRDIIIYIERLFYQFNASLTIISYLLKQDNINETYLNKYIEKSENLNIELEEAKEKISKDYCPEELKGKQYTYSFDFDKETIIYAIS